MGKSIATEFGARKGALVGGSRLTALLGKRPFMKFPIPPRTLLCAEEGLGSLPPFHGGIDRR